MSTTNSTLVVPVAIWGNSAPSHKITCLLHIPQQRLIVTGSQSGQIVVWNVSVDMHIHARFILFGHTDRVLCMEDVSESTGTHYLVSNSEKELCLWNLLEGTCVELVNSPLVHTQMRRVVTMNGRHAHPRLLCAGRYQDLHLVDPFNLEVTMSLQSRIQPDWCTSFSVLQHGDQEQQAYSVTAVTRLGMLKRWAFPTSSPQTSTAVSAGSSPSIMETDSVQLKGIDDVRSVAWSTFDRRLLLVIVPKRLFAFDSGDLTQLCAHEAPHDANWIGAGFFAVDRFMAWATNGHAYLFQLPASANPDSPNYRQRSLPSTAPIIYAILTHEQDAITAGRAPQLHNGANDTPELEPVFLFETSSGTEKNRASAALLIRGDVDGQLNCWQLASETLYIAPPPPARGPVPPPPPPPQRAENASTGIVTLRTAPRVPLIGADRHSSLNTCWQRYRPAGIIDHLAGATVPSNVKAHARDAELDQSDTEFKRYSRSNSAVSGLSVLGKQLLAYERNGADLTSPRRPGEPLLVTTSVYLAHMTQLVLGRSDGSIVVTSLLHALEREMLTDGEIDEEGGSGNWMADASMNSKLSNSNSHAGLCGKWPCNECVLIGDAHTKAVTCFFYPAAAAPGRFEQHALLSGGADFSVILWDARGFVKIAQFTSHGGPVSRFSVVPGTASGRLAGCIASVALDNSVLLLNVRERRMLLSATPHSTAVVTLKWRALEGLMLVQTADGTVYVWDVQVAALDRVLHGAAAQDALDAADFFEQLVAADHQRAWSSQSSTPVSTNPSSSATSLANSGSDASLLANISFLQALKRKNLQLVKNVAQQRIQTLQSQLSSSALSQDALSLLPGANGASQSLFNLADVKSQSVAIQGLRASPFDSEFHVAYFDIEAVIVQLLTDELLLCDPSCNSPSGADAAAVDRPTSPPPQSQPQSQPPPVATGKSSVSLNRAVSMVASSNGLNGDGSDQPITVHPRSKSRGLLRFGHHHHHHHRHDREAKETVVKSTGSPPMSPSGSGSGLRKLIKRSSRRSRDDVELKRATSRADFNDPEIALYRLRTKAGSGANTPLGSCVNLHRGESITAIERGAGESTGTRSPTPGSPGTPTRSRTSANLFKSAEVRSGGTATSEAQSPTDENEAIDGNALDIARLIVALLYVRGLDLTLDQLVEKRLHLAKPRLRRLAFGHVSRETCLCLLLPGWWNALPVDSSSGAVTVPPPPSPPSRAGVSLRVKNGDVDDRVAHELEAISLARWQLASTLTTQHLLSILSITNTMISLARVRSTDSPPLSKSVSFDWSLRTAMQTSENSVAAALVGAAESAAALLIRNRGCVVEDELDGSLSTPNANNGLSELTDVTRCERQAWSVLAAYHCALLPEVVSKRGVYKAPYMSILIQRWQDRCVEIRSAAQSLVLNELGRLGPEGRRRECGQWLSYMPSFILSQLSVGPSVGQQPPGELDLLFEEHCDADFFTRQCAVSHQELRRRHATSIVVLGVLHAGFGTEFEQARALASASGCTLELPGDKGVQRPHQQYAQVPNSYPLSAVVCRALTQIMLQPSSPRLPAFSPIRKCAVDLLGRGFLHFEPFIDSSAILFSLLDLASLYDDGLLAPFVQTGLPLVPAADLCRAARQSLSIIAQAKPSIFLVTLAKEVARFNALQLSQTSAAASAAQSVASSGLQSLGSALGTVSQQPGAGAQAAPAAAEVSSTAAAAAALGNGHPYLAILLRNSARRLVLRLVQRLVERSISEVYNLLIETIDIALFAVESNALKTRNLVELVPCLERFGRSLATCSQSRRLAVGSRQGQLAVYSLNRQLKIQTVAAHVGAVSALAFSGDSGRLLATYSHVDNKVVVWQCPMPTLFGMSQSHLKCVKTFHVAPVDLDAALRNQQSSIPAQLAQSLSTNRVAVSLLANDSQLLAHIRLARLLWLDTRTVSLATSDGQEHKLRF